MADAARPELIHLIPAGHEAKALQILVAARVLGHAVLERHGLPQPVAWPLQVGIAKHQILFDHLHHGQPIQQPVGPERAGQHLGLEVDSAGVVHPSAQHARKAVHAHRHFIPLAIDQVALEQVENLAPVQHRLRLSKGKGFDCLRFLYGGRVSHLANLQGHATVLRTAHGGSFQWLVV